jgi:protein O-GlcNAc transferase
MEERVPYKQCPLCASQAMAILHVGDCSKHALYKKALSPRIVWKQCGQCSHVFTEGYFTPQACEIIFSNTKENQKVGGAIEQNRLVSALMIDKVLPYASEGIWLDVGFGNGSLLFTAQEYGFKPVGVDLRSDNVAILKSLGIEAHCSDLADLNLHGQCAVISMADVLEHMPFPRKGLEATQALLKTGGALLISMPNSENMVWRIMNEQKANPYWGEIEHYHNFSRTTLYRLLEDHGLKPVRYGISERYRACMEVIAIKQ